MAGEQTTHYQCYKETFKPQMTRARVHHFYNTHNRLRLLLTQKATKGLRGSHRVVEMPDYALVSTLRCFTLCQFKSLSFLPILSLLMRSQQGRLFSCSPGSNQPTLLNVFQGCCLCLLIPHSSLTQILPKTLGLVQSVLWEQSGGRYCPLLWTCIFSRFDIILCNRLVSELFNSNNVPRV